MTGPKSLLSARRMDVCPSCREPDPQGLSECSDPLCPALRPGAFVTTRDELWSAFVEALPHGYIVEPGEYGDGRAYYILNRDLFDAIRSFCDGKECK